MLLSTHVTTDLERIADFVAFVHRGRLVFSETTDLMDRWVLVRGGLEQLDASARRFFKGVETSGVGFTGLTDQPAEARRRFLPPACVERASFDDVVSLFGCTDPGAR